MRWISQVLCPSFAGCPIPIPASRLFSWELLMPYRGFALFLFALKKIKGRWCLCGITACFSPGMSLLGIPGVVQFRGKRRMGIHVLLGATGQGCHRIREAEGSQGTFYNSSCNEASQLPTHEPQTSASSSGVRRVNPKICKAFRFNRPIRPTTKGLFKCYTKLSGHC